MRDIRINWMLHIHGVSAIDRDLRQYGLTTVDVVIRSAYSVALLGVSGNMLGWCLPLDSLQSK